MTPDRSNGGGGVVVVSMPQIAAPSQPQPQQSQVSLFPEEGVALERAVRELQAGGSATLQQVLEAAVAQQQLNSVLYSPTPSAESLQQHVQENMNSLRLGTTDNSLAAQQQMQLQQQQHQMHQFQQHQQLHQHLEQQRQVLGTMQIQQQLILQPQDQLQQQQQQMIENMQQQQLQQNQQQQVLNNIQLQEQQQQNQLLNNLQHHQLQQQQNQALSNLQQQQQLQEQVLENLQQQLQAELLQPQMHSSSQVQQPVSLLQQAGELLTIQTSFPTQPPSHTSPPQQLFQSPRSLAESQGSQQQVQAALLQNTLTVLASGSLASEQQSAGSTLYLSPNPQPQQQQQQQLAFISSIETSNQPQPVAIFQNQPQAQLSQMQQQSTPMEQQQSPQPSSQQPQLPMGQQSTLFQSIPNHLQVANPGSQSQLSQPQQTGLLLCTTELNPQAIPQAILFSTQTQGPSAAGGINVGIPQPEPAEPMSFQDQSSSHNNPASTENQQQNLFQDQQPMQVGPGSSSIPNSQPVELFLPQTSLTGLQNNLDSQEMNSQPAAPGTTIFVVQRGVGVVASPGQQPSDQLFQTNVGGNVAPQGQANLFVFSIQNGKTKSFPGLLHRLPSSPAWLLWLCFSPRFSPAAKFLRASTASSEPGPELQSHAASVGPVHVSSCPLSAGHHAQHLTEQPSGTNAVQFRERHADQPAERSPGQHTDSSAGWFTGLHWDLLTNSNADQSTGTDTEQHSESAAEALMERSDHTGNDM